jgi:hypothetical protein
MNLVGWSDFPAPPVPAARLAVPLASNDSAGNITGATFSVTDNNGNTNSKTITLDANHQFPIVAFEVNVVGPGNHSNSQFSSGAGTITYEISNGQLCVEGGLPDVCSKSSGSGIGWNAHLNQAIAAEVNEVQWPFGRYFGTHQLLKLDIGDRNIA